MIGAGPKSQERSVSTGPGCLNMLPVLMRALGYSRPRIVDALKDRRGTQYGRLIQPAEGIEADLPVPDRRLLDDVGELRSGNRSLYTALVTIIHKVRSVIPLMLPAPGSTLLHVLAGTSIDPALQILERRLKDGTWT